MSKTIADQLLDIVTAARELPEEAQQALVHEMAIVLKCPHLVCGLAPVAEPKIGSLQQITKLSRLISPPPL